MGRLLRGSCRRSRGGRLLAWRGVCVSDFGDLERNRRLRVFGNSQCSKNRNCSA